MATAESQDAKLHSGSLETGDVTEIIPMSHVLYHADFVTVRQGRSSCFPFSQSLS